MSLSGCITALATPFTASGELDLDAWRALLKRQADAGVRGVVVAGSTGEAAALSDDEYVALLRIAAEMSAGPMVVLAGTGATNTARTIAQTQLAGSAGAEVALVVVPPYVRPTQAGLVAHYRAVAEHGGLPVLMYNVPNRTGADMLPETVAELAAHPNIVGIKESLAAPERVAALLALRGDGFVVFSGDDGSAARSMLDGADGVVSVGSNALPASFRRLCELSRSGDRAAAEGWNARLQPFHDFLGVESNPIPVKALLQRQGIGRSLRLPLLPLSAAHHATADRLAALAQALEAESGRDALAA